ncbi:cation:proton antiporter [Histidinibacterium aquaticum]|uniref:Cation:proton antiporter n=1 Tax=Histidinibacterium aquaticum TaxID=2613962 RepID=A0A5J5GPB2_9RHOB|nr:cation:proton antiporter [Histidinibacterium aquaticum]KAA9009408.1 cation:proton antiporter [Histidinibacterium aquaticum]
MTLAPLLVGLGGLFFAGLVADYVGRRTQLPRVTILLICGMAVGQTGFDILPEEVTGLYEPLSVAALTMVAFLLGGSLTPETLRANGGPILGISLGVVLATVLAITLGLLALGVPLAVALLLGGIATATDPAATDDALRQGGAQGPFTDRLRGIVAVDDAWGIITFGVLMALALAFGGHTTEEGVVAEALWEIGGALALGAGIGLPAAYLTGRLSDGDPLRIEALGLVFLTAGLALWMNVSYLLAAMTAGAIVASLAEHHTRAFHEIEHIEWPFIILFFILAGASFDPSALGAAGLTGVAYVVLRILGRWAGGWIGARLCGVPKREAHWYGPALLPQAGIAIGMALVAGEAFPVYAETILTIAVASTVLFEIAGPWITVLAARRAA